MEADKKKDCTAINVSLGLETDMARIATEPGVLGTHRPIGYAEFTEKSVINGPWHPRDNRAASSSFNKQRRVLPLI